MTMIRRLLWGLPVIGALATGSVFLIQKGESAPGQPNGDPVKVADLKPAVSLPISQVIMFTYFVQYNFWQNFYYFL